MSATIHRFPGQSAACLSPTTECARLAMSGALEGFEHLVTGTIEHGRAILLGEVGTEAERQLIERSVLRLHCVTDINNDIVVRRAEPAQVRSQLPWTGGAVQPLIFRTSYCTLQEDTLADAINDDLRVLSQELHGNVGPAEAIVFYYGWHSDAVLIDVAIPATDALDRPRAGDLRASVVPQHKRSLVPNGGVAGLRSARQLLCLAAGATTSDQLFRIWQWAPLRNGMLAEDWLSATVYCSV